MNVSIVDVTSTCVGLTWYELYLLALAASDQPLDLHNPGKAKARTSIFAQIENFRTQALRLARFMLNDRHLSLFKASSMAGNRLKGIWLCRECWPSLLFASPA